jgi:hypothetical protein
MASWTLKTPYGDVICHKGRSFGEFVWKKPAPEKKYGVAYFSQKGHPLERDVYVHIKNKWIPSRGNDTYAKKMYWKKWKEMGSPKTIDGKKVGIIVKRVGFQGKKVGTSATMEWQTTKKPLADISLSRFVSKDMKYIIPEPEGLDAYRNVVAKLKGNNEVLITTNPIRLTANSGTSYRYAIVVIGNHLVYVEVVDKELQRPLPPDALIPSEEPSEIGVVEEEDVEGII